MASTDFRSLANLDLAKNRLIDAGLHLLNPAPASFKAQIGFDDNSSVTNWNFDHFVVGAISGGGWGRIPRANFDETIGTPTGTVPAQTSTGLWTFSRTGTASVPPPPTQPGPYTAGMYSADTPFAIGTLSFGKFVVGLNADQLDNNHADPEPNASTIATRYTAGRLKVGTPFDAADATTKAYVDNLVSGNKPVLGGPVRAATSGVLVGSYSGATHAITITANGAPSTLASVFDGVTLVANDRVLIKNQLVGSVPPNLANGIFTLSTVGTVSTQCVFTRALDADTPTEVTVGATVNVIEGTLATGQKYRQSQAVANIDTDPEIWVLDSTTTLVEGPGIKIQANKISFCDSAGYAAGDIFYASNTTTVARLPFVASRILRSDATSAPFWGLETPQTLPTLQHTSSDTAVLTISPSTPQTQGTSPIQWIYTLNPTALMQLASPTKQVDVGAYSFPADGGVALSALKSDVQLRINLGITPVWTALHKFTGIGGGVSTVAPNTSPVYFAVFASSPISSDQALGSATASTIRTALTIPNPQAPANLVKLTGTSGTLTAGTNYLAYDCTLALDQSIVPVWTGAHVWWSSTITNNALAFRSTAAGNNILQVKYNGQLGWGPGTDVPDTFLGRTSIGGLTLTVGTPSTLVSTLTVDRINVGAVAPATDYSYIACWDSTDNPTGVPPSAAPKRLYAIPKATFLSHKHPVTDVRTLTDTLWPVGALYGVAPTGPALGPHNGTTIDLDVDTLEMPTSPTLFLRVISAPKWTTPRNLGWTTEVTGSGTIDGSAPLTNFALTINKGISPTWTGKHTFNPSGTPAIAVRAANLATVSSTTRIYGSAADASASAQDVIQFSVSDISTFIGNPIPNGFVVLGATDKVEASLTAAGYTEAIGTGLYTIWCRFRVPSTFRGPTADSIFALAPASGAGYTTAAHLSIDSGGVLRFVIASSGSNQIYITGPTPIITSHGGRVVDVAVVRSAGNVKPTLYLDGVAITTTVTPSGTAPQWDMSVVSNYAIAGNFYDIYGSVPEFHKAVVFNRALTATEVFNLTRDGCISRTDKWGTTKPTAVLGALIDLDFGVGLGIVFPDKSGRYPGTGMGPLWSHYLADQEVKNDPSSALRGGLRMGVAAGDRVESTVTGGAVGTGDFTISLRFRVSTGTAGGVTYGLAGIVSVKTTQSNFDFAIWQNTGELFVGWRNASASMVASLPIDLTKYFGKVIDFTVRRTSGVETALINGSPIRHTPSSFANSTLANGASTLYVFSGNYSNTTSAFHDVVYSCRFFNRSLNDAEVLALVRHGVHHADQWGNLSGPVLGCVLDLDHGGASVLSSPDSSTNGFDGVVVGSPEYVSGHLHDLGTVHSSKTQGVPWVGADGRLTADQTKIKWDGTTFTVNGKGNFQVAIGGGVVPAGTAWIETAAGTTTVAPLRLGVGVFTTAAVLGNVEADSTRPYYTNSVPIRRGLAFVDETGFTNDSSAEKSGALVLGAADKAKSVLGPENLGTSLYTIWVRFLAPVTMRGPQKDLIISLHTDTGGVSDGFTSAINLCINGVTLEANISTAFTNVRKVSRDNFTTEFGGKVVDVVLVRSAGNVAPILYINGQVQTTIPGTLGTPPNWDMVIDSDAATIGNSYSANGSIGRIYRAAVFNRALSAAEVSTLIRQDIDSADQWGSVPAPKAGALVDFDLGVGCGSTIPDRSTRYHAPITGSTWSHYIVKCPMYLVSGLGFVSYGLRRFVQRAVALTAPQTITHNFGTKDVTICCWQDNLSSPAKIEVGVETDTVNTVRIYPNQVPVGATATVVIVG